MISSNVIDQFWFMDAKLTVSVLVRGPCCGETRPFITEGIVPFEKLSLLVRFGSEGLDTKLSVSVIVV